MPRSSYALLSLLWALLPDDGMSQPSTSTTYEVVFNATWSADTHPIDFPSSNPHFSGLIGGTHNGDVSFWTPGELASQGIEDMAELGSKIALTAEVEAAIGEGTAEFVLSGGGINPSPGSRSLTFDISPEKPLVTLVTMVAPSPDWFVGVHGLDLSEGDEWRNSVTVTLDVYDAGTDSGTTFTSPDDDTDPAQPIAILNTGPFVNSTVMGTYTFTRMTASGSTDEVPSNWEVVGPYPNPTSGRFSLDVSGPSKDPIRVAVHDITGRVVLEKSYSPLASTRRLDVDISRFAKGVYVVKLDVGEHSATRTVVVAD